MKRIGDILTRSKSQAVVQDGVSYKQVTIRMNYKGVVLRGIQDGSTILTKNQFAVSAGQFILSRIDARNGAFGIIPDALEGAIVTNDFLAFDINHNEVELEFFNVFLQSPIFLDACIRASRGNTNRKRVEETFFLNYAVNLPKVTEQRKLIKRINNSRMNIEVANAQITLQQTLLAQLRRAILQEAIQGKLTSNWRSLQSSVESARQLLARIQVERFRLIASKKLRTEKALPEVTKSESPFSIPTSWAWCRLGDVIQTYEAGRSFKCEDREVRGHEWGVIKTSAVTSGRFVERENKFLQTCEPDDTSAQILIGDLIFCRASGTKGLAGTCVTVPECSRKLLLSDKTIRVTFLGGINKEFVAIHNASDHSKTYLDSLSTGKSTSMNNVTRSELLRTPIPLPPVAEQAAIVERVKAIMMTCSGLEAELKKCRTHADRLRRAVLKEAFGSAT